MQKKIKISKFRITIGKFLAKHAPFLYALITSLLTFYDLEILRGHFKSALTWSAVDRSGQPIPWMSYPAIDYIENLNLEKKDLFEYGSGHSTLYFAKKVNSVTSIEDIKRWKNLIDSKRQMNTNILLRTTKKSYVESLQKEYDMIMIDGSYRTDCALRAVKYIKKGGLIILDDVCDYPAASKVLDKANFLKITFKGSCPVVSQEVTTAIYFSK